jgi:hypothetical protein
MTQDDIMHSLRTRRNPGHGPFTLLVAGVVSSLKTLELPFAQELDQVYVTLCRTSFLSKIANLPSLASALTAYVHRVG